MKLLTILTSSCVAISLTSTQATPVKHKTLSNDNPGMTLSRFAYGACWKPNRSQKHWEPIISNKPQLWLWLGDNIYADTEDMAVMKKKYEQLGNTPGYQKLAELCPVMATWDDHDYGKNDAGNDYVKRTESQKQFLEFFNERPDSARRQRAGVYTSYYFGKDDQRVQLILLDTRYFRTPLKKTNGKAPYRRMGKWTSDPSQDATILGAEQWKWLESELNKPARIRIIATSIQFVAPHNGYETWANMPAEKQRMIDLIKKTRAKGLVFLSGDIHSSELCIVEPEGCYPLIDFTSSSLNVPLGAALTHRRTGPAFGGANFGLIEIDWSTPDPVIQFSTKDTSNKTRLHHRVALSKLSFKKENLLPISSPAMFAGEWQTFYGPLTIAKTGDSQWSGKCADRTLKLTQTKHGLEGIWKGTKQHGKVMFSLTRDGRFLNGAYSHENLPLQLDWAGWKPNWEKHFIRDDHHLRNKRKTKL